MRKENAGNRLQELLRARRLPHERSGLATDGDIRAPTVNYERDRSLSEARAERSAVARAKNQIENGCGQTALLGYPQSLVEGYSDKH